MNKLHIGSTQYTNSPADESVPADEQSTQESVDTAVEQQPINPNISFKGGSVHWTGGKK